MAHDPTFIVAKRRSQQSDRLDLSEGKEKRLPTIPTHLDDEDGDENVEYWEIAGEDDYGNAIREENKSLQQHLISQVKTVHDHWFNCRASS